MCGIVGIFDLRERRESNRELLVRMNDSQLHRGPDESGVHIEPGVALGHRRLSIIDLASGQQPLFNADGSIVVTYNGEIYNYHELRETLIAAGYQFATHSDTEVIVNAWDHWGEACVEQFRGMFAFAVWDRKRQTFFLARDRLGIKPLFYAQLPDGQFLFGSELKSLLVHPDLPRELEPRAIEEYFGFGYIPEPRTILRHAFKLPPGHCLTLKPGQDSVPASRAYWDVPFEAHDSMDEQEAAEELIRRFREAVREGRDQSH